LKRFGDQEGRFRTLARKETLWIGGDENDRHFKRPQHFVHCIKTRTAVRELNIRENDPGPFGFCQGHSLGVCAGNAEHAATMSRSGYAAVTSTDLRGRPALRLCTINPRTTEDDATARDVCHSELSSFPSSRIASHHRRDESPPRLVVINSSSASFTSERRHAPTASRASASVFAVAR